MSDIERAGRDEGIFASVRRGTALLGIGFVVGIIVGIVFSFLIKTILIIAAAVIVLGALARGFISRRS